MISKVLLALIPGYRLDVAVMVTLPIFLPVAMPLLSTVAIAVSEDFHVTEVSAPSGLADAYIWAVPSRGIKVLLLETDRLFRTGMTLTVTVFSSVEALVV